MKQRYQQSFRASAKQSLSSPPFPIPVATPRQAHCGSAKHPSPQSGKISAKRSGDGACK